MTLHLAEAPADPVDVAERAPTSDLRERLTIEASVARRRSARIDLLVRLLDQVVVLDESVVHAGTERRGTAVRDLLVDAEQDGRLAELAFDCSPGADDRLVPLDRPRAVALLLAAAVLGGGRVTMRVEDDDLVLDAAGSVDTGSEATASDDTAALAGTVVDQILAPTGIARSGATVRLATRSDERTDGRTTGVRALVVEDNATNQILARKQLERLDVTVEVIGTGLAAVDLAADERFDVIFMDWNLPDIDGLEVTRRIRTGGASSTTPIIAMTANAMAGDREACLEAGMDDFLSKPVRMQALTETLRRWTESGDAARPGEVGQRIVTDVGGVEVATAIIESFLDELEQRVAAITASDDDESGRRAAHTLKSTAALLGLEELSSHCAEVERGGAVDRPRLDVLAERARRLMRDVLDEIRLA